MSQVNAEIKYLTELSKSYPTQSAVKGEIINLSAILNLPKGTEHFMSDLHGEYEAFSHIRRNASGVIRKKVDALFSDSMIEKERAELATLIYYPKEKLDEIRDGIKDINAWYKKTLISLVEIARLLGAKYTRSRVRKLLTAAAGGYDHILDELINSRRADEYRGNYYDNIIDTIVETRTAEEFIFSASEAIKSLVIDHMHIVGDIYDRGPRADLILDQLMKESSIDIQWGNHDVLWMGAAAGSRTCIAAVLNNSITYKNLDVVEIGYGISLRPLSLFADEVYKNSDISAFLPKGDSSGDSANDDDLMIARMHKAISVIQFKLEGQTIIRNPSFKMHNRLLLDKIDRERGTVHIAGKDYPLCDTDFPTVYESSPYELTRAEADVMRYLKNAFMRSEKLAKHVRFLYEVGEIYTVYNGNLLFHGCIPIDKHGEFLALDAAGGLSGRALMDYADKAARIAYFSPEGSEAKQICKDFIWFLWCGKNSPLSAREKIATFERLLVTDEKTWVEPKNPYYDSWNDQKIAEKILLEFGLDMPQSHIINGHIPIKYKRGERPIKAGGRLIVIDGGFCRAYRKTTGIGGYTLIYNADGMRLAVHEPFTSVENAIKNNADIVSDTVVFDHASSKIRVKDTDRGKNILSKIEDLKRLLNAYETGTIKER